jgi:hypothetical protein
LDKVPKPRDLGTQIDLIHPNCGVHMASILHDETTGAAVFKCSGCNLTVVVSYFDENPPSETVHEKEGEAPVTAPTSKRRSRAEKSG